MVTLKFSRTSPLASFLFFIHPLRANVPQLSTTPKDNIRDISCKPDTIITLQIDYPSFLSFQNNHHVKPIRRPPTDGQTICIKVKQP
ncbi:hypothetical protein GE09DRAFT_1128367, partial [Coniochaeta sp. 2T2.1]